MKTLFLLLILSLNCTAYNETYVVSTDSFEENISIELTTDCLEEIDLQYTDKEGELEISQSDYEEMQAECRSTYEY